MQKNELLSKVGKVINNLASISDPHYCEAMSLLREHLPENLDGAPVINTKEVHIHMAPEPQHIFGGPGRLDLSNILEGMLKRRNDLKMPEKHVTRATGTNGAAEVKQPPNDTDGKQAHPQVSFSEALKFLHMGNKVARAAWSAAKSLEATKDGIKVRFRNDPREFSLGGLSIEEIQATDWHIVN